MRVGVCDWGIGGLGFFNLLRADRPDIDVVYIGDQGVPGYGTFDRHHLAPRIRSVFRTFRELGVADVVVACNAASTVLDDAHVDGISAVGMIKPTLEALADRQVGQIGVIGGRRTIRSGAYGRPLRARGWQVRQRVAQPLSQRIEKGEAATPDTLSLLTEILAPLDGVDLIVLACTHYVVLEPEVRRRLPGAGIIDPAAEAWRRFAPSLPSKAARIGESKFLTTGPAPLMAEQAMAAFGVTAEVEEIRIE